MIGPTANLQPIVSRRYNNPLFAAAIFSLSVFAPLSVSSAPVEPTFDRFGALGTEFGGDGIPSDAVAITERTIGSNEITLGLAATERFSNPPVADDGAGTYRARRGANFGGNGESSLRGARWNFSYATEIVGGGTYEDFQFDILYDFDPARNTDESDLGILDFNQAILSNGGTLGNVSLIEGSQNLNFGFLADGTLDFISPPTGSFDPNATGEYSFILRASDSSGNVVGESAINVNVVPVPATAPLLGLGLVGLALLGRREQLRRAGAQTAK